MQHDGKDHSLGYGNNGNHQFLSVDHVYLIRLALDDRMSWMGSLCGLRSYKQVPSGCCGKLYVAPVPPEVIKTASQHPDFLNDMRLLKKKLGVERVIVNVAGCRTTV